MNAQWKDSGISLLFLCVFAFILNVFTGKRSGPVFATYNWTARNYMSNIWEKIVELIRSFIPKPVPVRVRSR
jgi:hypothetical protein